MKAISYMFFLVLLAVLHVHVTAQQVFSVKPKMAYATATDRLPRRLSVQKELKLSAAQREEILSIVASLKNDTRAIRRKLDALKEDYKLACLTEKPDKKELSRLLTEIQLSKSEIHILALSKMDEIKQLLTSSQSSKLAELRRVEQERLAKERETSQGDVATDNRSRMPSVQSFTMQSWSTSQDDEPFSADDVFIYPDRELWLDRDLGRGFGFSTNSDGDAHGFSQFRNFFGGGANGLADRFPQFQHFNFDGPESSDSDSSSLMDSTPYTLPKQKYIDPPSGSGGEREPENTASKKRSDQRNNLMLKRQIEQMKERLQLLEQKLDQQNK